MSACDFLEKTEAEIVDEYSPLVVSQALKFRPNKLTGFDDYMQAGYIGLLRAIRKFDSTRNTKFSTFSIICIRRQILKEYNKLRMQPSSFEDKEDENIKEPFWEFEPDYLSDIERRVLSLRLQGYTYEQIGSQMGFTKSWASELLSNAIRKIREANAKT
jgi:RNA polymerase sigma factor (sigma-70 family)|tara:strand:+ start:66 stop:542 length:477 start_codon:yes stop_codon:yes gene_type:complete